MDSSAPGVAMTCRQLILSWGNGNGQDTPFSNTFAELEGKNQTLIRRNSLTESNQSNLNQAKTEERPWVAKSTGGRNPGEISAEPWRNTKENEGEWLKCALASYQARSAGF